MYLNIILINAYKKCLFRMNASMPILNPHSEIFARRTKCVGIGNERYKVLNEDTIPTFLFSQLNSFKCLQLQSKNR